MLSLLLSVCVCAQEMSDSWTLVIHGGAGNITQGSLTPEREAAYNAALQEALKTGNAILKDGGSSLDAVEATIQVLEDSPLFNAGKGAVFASSGQNELDASIMDGRDQNAGAVAGVTTVKNPISAARAVMEKSPHVLLAGEGADAFASEQGLEIVEPSYFYEEARFKRFQEMQEREVLEKKLREEMNGSPRNTEQDNDSGSLEPAPTDSKFGTVGAVAIDRYGNMAAGTSTGGMTYKRWGRIGDSPLIGAGTYAKNETCAVSCTGHGEYFIRGMVAYDLCAKMEYEDAECEEAAEEIIHEKLPQLGGSGGLIAVDEEGNVVWQFNTQGMFRGSADQSGWMEIGMYQPGTEKSVKIEE